MKKIPKWVWIVGGLALLAYLASKQGGSAQQQLSTDPKTMWGEVAREARAAITDVVGVFGGDQKKQPQNGVDGLGLLSHRACCATRKWGPQ